MIAPMRRCHSARSISPRSKAASIAALAAGGPPPAVTGPHIEAALEQLNAGGQLARRILGFESPGGATRTTPPGPMAVGFPSVVWEQRG